uniref:Uncharacterized protein n=1 Tax=Anisakis simplex TaxID=6269 RepID=A0A0M3JHN6_ANISI
LSRSTNLVIGQWCPVFLTISNFSSAHTQLVITPRSEQDDRYVKVFCIGDFN